MRCFASLLWIGFLFAFPATLSAQFDDPFGGPAKDPFGGPRQADPFGGKPQANPVGGPRQADPFGKHPFGNRRQADPFGQPAAARNVPAGQARDAKAPPQNANALANQKGDAAQANQRIRAALQDQTTQTFVELPLEDAVRQLSEDHDIPIVVDRRAIEELGLTADVPVSMMLKNVTLSSFLRLMLRQFDLTYVIKDEVLQITTIEAAEQDLVVQMYTFPEDLVARSDRIVKALTDTVVPDAWNVRGGPSTIHVIDNVLIVSSVEVVHEDVIGFMKKLEQAYQRRISGERR